MSPQLFGKDEDEKLDYSIRWVDWLDADTISLSTWTVDTGITIESDSSTATTTTVWLSGGTAGERYTALNHIVTAAGREAERSIYVDVSEQ